MSNKNQIRIAAGQFSSFDEETMKMVRQLGVESVQFNTPNLPGDERWEYEDLKALKDRCDQFGLTLEAIENVPIHFYEKVMLGLPGKEKQLENYKAIIRNMGKAGIPILGYHFMPNFVWRTSAVTEGRAGAKVTSFDMSLVDKGNIIDYPYSEQARELQLNEDMMWENYALFLKEVLPVAEESGVKLALHPDDPPVPTLDGVSRIFYRVENFKKAMDMANSDAWGLDLCLGCCSEMTGGVDNVNEMIEYFGPKGKIFYVHFRDVQGTVPYFQECFLGEGNYDPAKTIVKLRDNGFTGFLLDDHVPHIENDTPWGHRSHAHAIGYMQGLLNMMELKTKDTSLVNR